MILRRYLHPLKKQQVDTLILGCTHYPLLIDLIQPRMGKGVTLIDSSTEVAKEVSRFIQERSTEVKGQRQKSDGHRFFFSDATAAAEKIAAHIFGHPVTLLRP